MARPSVETYEACLQVPIPPIVYNIKTVLNKQPEVNLIKPSCTKLVRSIQTLEFTMAELREDLYTILIFDMGVEKIIWNILTTLEATHEQRILMIKETIQFLQYFNNNYRPIYHLEKYIYALIKIIHGI
jgi:hypothetical protein